VHQVGYLQTLYIIWATISEVWNVTVLYKM